MTYKSVCSEKHTGVLVLLDGLNSPGTGCTEPFVWGIWHRHWPGMLENDGQLPFWRSAIHFVLKQALNTGLTSS